MTDRLDRDSLYKARPAPVQPQLSLSIQATLIFSFVGSSRAQSVSRFRARNGSRMAKEVRLSLDQSHDERALHHVSARYAGSVR